MAYNFDETREEWEKFKGHWSYSYIIGAIRGAWIFMLYFITTWLAYACGVLFLKIPMLQADLAEVYALYPTIVIAVSVFLLNSTMINFANFNRAERLAFMERYNEETDRQSERRLILRNMDFWAEISIFTLLFYLTFAKSTLFLSAFDLLEKIPFINFIPTILRKLVLTVLFFGASFGLNLHSRLEARNFWLNPDRDRVKGERLWESKEKRQKRCFSPGRRIGKLLASYGVILVGATVAPMSVAIILNLTIMSWGFIKLFAGWASKAVFWVIVVILFFLVFGLAIRKRLLFLHNLKRTCKTCGFRLIELKHPFLALFRDFDGYTFCIEANGEVYYCRLIASVKRSNKMIFLPDGTATRNLSFHIPQPALGGVRGFVQMYDRGTGDDREFARYAREFRYDFECGKGKKILLLNPVPRRAIYECNGHKTELDNGSVIGEKKEYTVYSGNAFLRLLKRESMKDE